MRDYNRASFSAIVGTITYLIVVAVAFAVAEEYPGSVLYAVAHTLAFPLLAIIAVTKVVAVVLPNVPPVLDAAVYFLTLAAILWIVLRTILPRTDAWSHTSLYRAAAWLYLLIVPSAVLFLFASLMANFGA